MNRRFIAVSTILVAAGLSTWVFQREADRPMVPLVKARPVATNSPANLIKLPLRLATATFVVGVSGGKANPVAESLSDLIAAQLSHDPSFILIERQKIDTVLDEIARSLSQQSEQKAVIKAGHFIGADWFLLGAIPTERTNIVVFKVIDIHSGIVRDLTSVQLGTAKVTEAAADDIVRFVRNATNNVVFSNCVFVGIGGFADLSINDRYPNFSKDIRRELEHASQGKRIRLVERGMIHPLLRELQFNTAGLTDQPTIRSSVQPAMYLIDGIFQSYQDEQAKISLGLRIQKIGSPEQLFTFTEPMGKGLVDQVVATIDEVLAKDKSRRRRVSNREEAAIQFERGKVRSDLGRGFIADWGIGGLKYSRDPEKRRRNIEEAIEAFEAAVFLVPNHDEAKLYLGICLGASLIGRAGEAQDIFQEIIAASTNQQCIATARSSLEAILPKPPTRPLSQEEQVDQETSTWLQKCKHAAENGAGNPFDLADNTYNVFLHLFNFDRVATRKHLDTTLGRIEAEYPQLAPYFAGSYLRWRTYNSMATAEQIEKLDKTLDWCHQNPDKLKARPQYYSYTLFQDIDWCMTSNRFDIAEKAIKLVETLEGGTPKAYNNSTAFQLRKGAVLMGLQKWPEALHLFESMAEPNSFSIDVSKQIGICREKLGQTAIASTPIEFKLGKPVRLFLDAPVLKHDGKRLWVAAQDRVYHYTDGVWNQVTMSPDLRDHITALAVNDTTLACGTRYSGVFICERATVKWRHYDEADGFMVSSIEGFCFSGPKLWIAFGDRETEYGGVGYIDLTAQRFVGITPKLEKVGRGILDDGETQAPKRRVRAVHQDDNGLWAGVQGKGLQRYDLNSKQWDTASSLHGFQRSRFPAISDGQNQITGISVTPLFVAVSTDQTGSHASSEKYWGGLSFSSVATNDWKILTEQQGLPSNYVLSVAIDGNQLWTGGRGFLARVDMSTGRITHVCNTGNTWVHSIEVMPDVIWVGVGNQLVRQQKDI